MAKSIRCLVAATIMIVPVLISIAPACAEAPAATPSMDAIPMLRQALDRPPPLDAFESAVLQQQFEMLGFKAAADRLDDYQRLRLLGTVMPPPAQAAATLRDVVAGARVTPALRAAVARAVADGVAIGFPAIADVQSASAPHLQMSEQGLAHIDRLAPGAWGYFKGGQVDPAETAAQAEAFYLAADMRNRLAMKADLHVEYELPSGQTLSCEADEVPAGDHRGGLCQVRLVGHVTSPEGIRWMALTPEQKTALYDNLLALRQTAAPVPKEGTVRIGELHLTIDTASGATLDGAWRAAAATEARQRLQAAPCEALGNCAAGVAQQATSPAAIHAGLTLLVMACLVVYRFRQGGTGRLWPTLAKLYAMLLVLAIGVNAVDSPTGATRGAPLSGTLGFMAKAAVSMPWSYYFASSAADPSPRPGVPAMPLADDSPWFWGFAGVNLVFLLLMAAGGAGQRRDTSDAPS